MPNASASGSIRRRGVGVEPVGGRGVPMSGARGEPASDDRAAAQRLSVALALGAATGVLADTYLPLARAGWCVASPLGLLWPLAAGAALVTVVALALRAVRTPDAPTVMLGAIAALWVAALLVLNLVPPIARDELTYHLAFPARYLRAGRVYELPFAIQSYYPMLVDMFYLPLLGHVGEQASKYLHLLYGLATAGLLLLYLIRRVPARSAAWAAVLLLTTPTVAALAASAYVDLGLLFYAAIGLIGLLHWSETRRRADFLAAAVGAGCAASVKYNGALVAGLLAAGAALACTDRGARRALGAVLAFGLVSLIPLLPWLLKNIAETGNPVYPLAPGLFGGPPLVERSGVGVFLHRSGLYGESAIEMALAPVRVFVTGREGDPARFDGVFNPLYLIGLATLLLPGTPRRIRGLAAFAALVLVFVFFLTVYRSRYLVAVLPPLAIVVAETFDRWERERRLRPAVAALISAGALAFNAGHFAMFWQRVDPLAYALGRETRAEYLGRFIPEYPVTAYANAHLPSEATVYLGFLGDRGYYWNARYVFDTHSPGLTLREAVRGAADAAGVAAALRRRGIGYLASADGLLNDSMRRMLAVEEFQRWESFVRTRLRPLYRERGVGLYEIR